MENMAGLSYLDERKARLFYYRGARTGMIDLVLERESGVEARKFIFREKIDLRELEILKAFSQKIQNDHPTSVQLTVFAPVSMPQKIENIHIFPWEFVPKL